MPFKENKQGQTHHNDGYGEPEHNDYYEMIRSKRNEMFPPKLEFGADIAGNEKVTSLSYIGCSNGQHSLRLVNDGVDSILFVETIKDKEILGLPVILNDILLMIEKKIYGYMLVTHGNLRVKDCKENEHFIKIDITKSIKDQTPEVLKKLLELIK